ncbi:uncharacterized protein LOC108911851 isoform X1 [Anoplophora glabripennis]|uniref:uncharacterized protein LOC108911851 isoform X1 n=1 Tax=Anoplophora glabripennis TaxID=217634 RepID=UPI000C7695F0|nr:uncharacterized protein LOC108911851 isoform X1 [Anoplophora glabripennis]
MFIEKKREIFIGKGNTGGNTLSELAIKDQFEICLAYHRNLALEVILTKADTDLFSNCCRSDKDMETYLLKIGIVQKSDEEYQFIHRTFAEYFVAQSVLREIHLENQNVLFHRFLIDELLLKPEFEVIRAFFDSLLQNCSLNYNLFENYLSFTYESSLRYWKCNENLIFVLSGEGHVAILHLILKSIHFKATGGQEINIKHWRVDRKNMNTLRYLGTLVREGGVNIRDENGYMPLHRAIMGCHFEMVKFLVEQGANVDGTDEERNTGLILAASEGCLDIINLLLQHGAAINITNNDGRTARHEAAECGYLDIVKHLVGSNADCNIKDNYGRTVLHLAAQSGHLDAVEYLLGLGADFDVRDNDGSTVLHLACARGCLDTVKYFVGLNADVNAKDKNGQTLLHVASECGYLEIVEYLTKHVDSNIRDNEGHTALHLAVMKGYLEIVKYLKKDDQDFGINDNKGRTSLHLAAANDFLEIASEIGGEVNVTDNNGCTPLHLAAGKGYMDIVQYLVEGGADINAKDNKGRTVLHSACLTNKLDCIKYLMKRGADCNTRDNRGCTVLHLTAADGYLDTIMFLVGLGVNFNIKDDNGRTAFHFAALKGKLRTVKYLAGLGVDLNIKDNDGQSALHYAIFNDTLDTAKYLTEQGVNPNIKNNHSRTPLHIAALYGKLDAVKYLMQLGADSNIKDENGKTAFDYVDNGDFVKFIMELDMKSNNSDTVEIPLFFEIDVTEEDNMMNIEQLVTNLDTVTDISESELYSLELNVDSTENLSNRNLYAEGNGELDTIKNAIGLPEHSLNDNITCNDNSTIPNLSAHNNDLNTVKYSNINEVELNSIEPNVERAVDLHNDELDISKNTAIEQAVDIISGYNIKGRANSIILNLTAPNIGLDTVENFIEHAAGLNNRDIIPANNNGSTLLNSATVKGDLDTVKHSDTIENELYSLELSVERTVDLNNRQVYVAPNGKLNTTVDGNGGDNIQGYNDSTLPNLNGDLDTVKSFDINESELGLLELSVERTENLNNQDLHTGRNGELDTMKDVIKHAVDVSDDNTIQGNDDFTSTNLIVQDSDLDTVKHSGKNKDELASVALNDELNTSGNVGEISRDNISTALHSFGQDNDDTVVSNLFAQNDDLEIVKQFAEHDVDDIISNDDHTASHLPAEEGDLDKQFIEKVSKVQIKDNNQGRTTLQSGTGQNNQKKTRCPLCKII